MLKRKVAIFLLIVSVLLLPLPAAAATDADQVVVVLTIGSSVMTVNGAQTEVDPGLGTTPVLEQGKTFLPIRTLVEALGGTISYDTSSKAVSISLDEQIIKLTIGSTAATVNGQSQTLDVAPFVSKTGRTMLPLRFIGSNLNSQVAWDSATKQITVTYDVIAEEPIPTATPWTGNWDTKLGALAISQDGSSITGTFDEDSITITGTVYDENKVSGVLLKDKEDAGEFEFTLAEDGQSFIGQYKYAEDKDWSELKGTIIIPATEEEEEETPTTELSWAGTWDTKLAESDETVELVISQDGDDITGTFDYEGEPASIAGTVDENTVSGTIILEDEEDAGEFEFTLAEDGKSFTGKCKYADDEDWSEWNGTLIVE